MMDNTTNIKGKKLLLLGGSDVHCKVVEAAKKMGVYTIVTDYLVNSPAKKIADEQLMLSILDTDSIIEYCKENAVDGVLNFCNDPAQKAHQVICDTLGFPRFGTSDQVFALSNKKRFKEVCIANGIDIIPEYTEIDVANNKVLYPVIAKPVDSRGSRGVTVCNNKEELISALPNIKKESGDGSIIIEKYMGGKQDFTMTYFVIANEPYLICTHDRYLGKVEDKLDRQCVCQFGPSKHLSFYLDHIDSKMKKMIKNLGIEYGPVFFQGFIDGETLRVYDPGNRFPGTEYETAFLRATGIDLMSISVEYALGGEINRYADQLEGAFYLNGYRTASLLIDSKPGRIHTFEGIDKISAIAEVTRVTQKAFPGDVIPETGDVKQRVCEVTILMPNNCEEIRNTIKKVQSLLRVEDEEGFNMMISSFDSSLVCDYFIMN